MKKEKILRKLRVLRDYFTTNIFLLGVVLTISWPLMLWVVPWFRNGHWPVLGSYFGYVIVFMTLIVIFLYVVKRIKHLVYLFFIIFTLLLAINNLRGHYGFKDIAKDYFALVSDLQNQSQLISVMSSDYEPFVNATKLQELVNVKSSETRNFAVKIATKHFRDNIKKAGDRKFIQYLSVFKEINSKWIYVEDPEGEEYFASPDETIQHMAVDGNFSGDCDDHAILMAACLKFVGAKVRLVRTPTHVYPEIKVSTQNELDRIVELIRRELFKNESYGNSIYYHTDVEGNIWLNFDYTNSFPGGKFLDDKIVGILEF